MLVSAVDTFFFFKQKTAYEMRISDWSSDVCSSDLDGATSADAAMSDDSAVSGEADEPAAEPRKPFYAYAGVDYAFLHTSLSKDSLKNALGGDHRSEEHTSELQSLMRISYAVFCLKKKKTKVKQS